MDSAKYAPLSPFEEPRHASGLGSPEGVEERRLCRVLVGHRAVDLLARERVRDYALAHKLGPRSADRLMARPDFVRHLAIRGGQQFGHVLERAPRLVALIALGELQAMLQVRREGVAKGRP
ncbi:MAG TPA: hypothetical protein VH040_14930 [Usitatibacter sp.]|jgi:hypothetical protein|nr:hypothetical protein [Usitatibacter sp.]